MFDAFLRKRRINWNIRSAGLYNTQKRDQHFWFAMSKDCDGSAVMAIPLQKVSSHGIRVSG
jgi:hypothetical protein